MVDHDNLEASSSIGVTGTILVLVTLMVLWNIHRYFKQCEYREVVMNLIILFSMPVFIGWTSWISLYNKKELVAISFLSNLFKSICLVTFFLYIEKMLGRVENGRLLYSSSKKLERLCSNVPPKCALRCIKVKEITNEIEARAYLKRIRISVYQFCFVLIGIAIIGTIMMIATDDYDANDSKFKTTFTLFRSIEGISSVIALCALLNIGIYVDRLPGMEGLSIIHKFIIIKLGLIFTELQPIIIQIFAELDLISSTSKYSVEEITIYTNALMVCSEMIIISFLILLVYPLKDYKSSFTLLKEPSLSS